MQPQHYHHGVCRKAVPVFITLFELKNYEPQVAFIQAFDYCSKVYLIDKSYLLVCKTLGECQKILNKRLFCRSHRSWLVNTAFVTSIPCGKNARFIELMNGSSVPLARRKKTTVKKFIEKNRTYVFKNLYPKYLYQPGDRSLELWQKLNNQNN